jgi:hypothetical protein
MNRAAVAGLAILAVLGGIRLGLFAALSASPGATPGTGSGLVAGLGSAVPSVSPAPSPAESASARPSTGPSPSAVPSATPTPGPSLVPAPLTGALVTAAAAARHPIAVMIDDQIAARPQSGLSSASIVWQAPAEGGIPRYMLIFQETTPTDVGPVRSARYYYVAWASELRAMYVHSGGSPQALATLRAQGNGQLVYNADEFRWGGSFHRISTRASPHNLYTTGAKLRALATRVGARDGPITWPWTFARDAVLGWRPVGGRIVVSYQANVIRYDYDRKTNTYLRSVTGEKRQVDGTTKRRIAPKNVIVMQVRFGPLNDGNPSKKRLEADIIGSGPAWISTNGITIKGTWRKASTKAPTRFFDKAGKPVVLTVGQTFVQVMKTTDSISFTPGKPAPPDPRTPGPLPL